MLNGQDIHEWLQLHPSDTAQPTSHTLRVSADITELFIVHHVNGNHYILHVVDLSTGDFHTFDSYHQTYPRAVKTTQQFVARIRPQLGLAPPTSVPVERQANGSDCGFWVIRNATCWATQRTAAPSESTGDLRLGLLSTVERRFRRLVDRDIALHGDAQSADTPPEILSQPPSVFADESIPPLHASQASSTSLNAQRYTTDVLPSSSRLPSALVSQPVWSDDYIAPGTLDLEENQPVYHRAEQH